MKFHALTIAIISGGVALVAAACGSSDTSEFGNGGKPDASDPGDGGFDFTNLSDAFDQDAFFASDPPPMSCPVPGYVADDAGVLAASGSTQCPTDKNRQGCACPKPGEKASCWPGLRANRNIGICKDGTTTCTQINENSLVWGACEGYVLPSAQAKSGKAACKCFSEGQWKLDNLIPCFFDYDTANPGKKVFAVSTVLEKSDAGGADKAVCPTGPQFDTSPPPAPTTVWTPNSLKVDCEGRFKLCYTLKAGSYANPLPTDCSLMTVCTEGDYPKRNVVTKFPDLPPWKGNDSACAAQFAGSGGYGEMTVLGKDVRCDAIDDGAGKPEVFARVSYCSQKCGAMPSLPECATCQQNGGGIFK